MDDSNSLKVMCIFEAGARMKYGSELTCLAAHIYHRFFRVKEQTGLYDLCMFGSASIQLAHQFFGKHFDGKTLCLVMMDILHGQELFVESNQIEKLIHSINLAAKVICTNLDYQINFKDTRWTTPGQLQEQYRERMAAMPVSKGPAFLVELVESDKSSSSEDDDDECGLTKADRLLRENDKFLASSHRYLVHYLKLLKSQVAESGMDSFIKICNVAWTFMCDCYWSPCVTQILSSHLACACLMLAIEIYRPALTRVKRDEQMKLLKTLDKKWNLIFCDDLTDNHLRRAIDLIVLQYNEYDRVIQHELSTFVIDPSRR